MREGLEQNFTGKLLIFAEMSTFARVGWNGLPEVQACQVPVALLMLFFFSEGFESMSINHIFFPLFLTLT